MAASTVIKSLPMTPESAIDALAAGAPPTVDWQKLRKLFWTEYYDSNFRGRRSSPSDETEFSESAWERLQQVIRDTPLPVTLSNVRFGFTVGMRIWTESAEPFPGAFVEPAPLFTVDPNFLPGCPRASFDYAWATLSPIVQRPENIVLLKRGKLELPRDQGHYAY